MAGTSLFLRGAGVARRPFAGDRAAVCVERGAACLRSRAVPPISPVPVDVGRIAISPAPVDARLAAARRGGAIAPAGAERYTYVTALTSTR